MTEHDRVDYLAGQLDALIGFARAMIKSHASRQQLEAAFRESEQMGLALSESTTVSEAYLDGQRETNETLSGFFQERTSRP